MDADVELSWWDWLVLQPRALRERGANPEHRFREIGHALPLSPHWANTVGAWRVQTSAEIRALSGTTANALRVFKHKHCLMTREKYEAPQQLWVAETVAQSVERLLPTEGHGRAQQRAGRDHGVLPVEASLYHLGYTEVLSKAGLTTVQYQSIPDTVKRGALWALHGGFAPFEAKP